MVKKLFDEPGKSQRFKSIFESMVNIPVQGYNKNREVIYWNQASSRAYGYSREEAYGQKIEDLIIPHHMRGQVIHDISKWYNEGIPIPAAELYLSHKDGTRIPVYSSHVMVVNSKGEKEMFCVDIELTQLKQMEKKLQKSLNFNKSLIQAIPFPIFWQDKTGAYQGCNKAFTREFGISESEIENKRAEDLWPPEQITLFEQTDNEAFDAGKSSSLETQVVKASGEVASVILVKNAYYNNEGETTGIIGAFIDITSRKEAERLLLKIQGRIKEKSDNINQIADPELKDTIIVGGSAPIMKVHDQIYQAANTNMSTLIEGESGTGKELVARIIHSSSKQANNPMVVVNCGSIPEQLMESMFFGHKKGAFTGAHYDSEGFIQKANGGTLFLDEINSLPHLKQSKLLRVLDTGYYTPVGSNKPAVSDFRLICASNENLMELVKKGDMRSDFYYRINILTIKVPALRERKEDIQMLARYFLLQYQEKISPESYFQPATLNLDRELFKKLESHDYPGNVRELKNILFRYFTIGELLFDQEVIPQKQLQPPVKSTVIDPEVKMPGGKLSLKDAMQKMEGEYIKKILKNTKYNRTKTAEILGITRKTLYSKMQKYSL